LGAAVVGRLHALAGRATDRMATPAHVQLRVGAARLANASRYRLHYDRGVENFLMQVSGSKRLALAPPSQAVHTALHSAAFSANGRGADHRHSGEGGGPRHSPIDFSLPHTQLLARWPAASRLRGLRVALSEGEVLFVPRGWLHMVEANDAHSSRGLACDEAGGGRTCKPGKAQDGAGRIWLSANLFFTHRMQPTFRIFDSCDGSRVQAERERMPVAYAAAFDRLGAERARAAYCTS
jgi:hypothetical protein